MLITDNLILVLRSLASVQIVNYTVRINNHNVSDKYVLYSYYAYDLYVNIMRFNFEYTVVSTILGTH